MSLGNLTHLREVFQQPNSHLLPAQEQDQVTISRSSALGTLAAATWAIGEIVISSLGVAGVMDNSYLGWTLTALSGAAILGPVLKFFCSNDSFRTQTSLTSHIIAPIILNAAPLVSGALTATGHLAGTTAGVISLAVSGGLVGLVCCCGTCVACCMAGGAKLTQGLKEKDTDQNITTSLLADRLGKHIA